MCNNKEKIFTYSAGAFFSYNSKELKNPDQVANSGIYHPTGYSASTCIWMIKALLDKYEIDYTEFSYSARSNKK